MLILVTFKYFKDPPLTALKRWRHHHSHYEVIGISFRLSRADYSVVDGPIGSKFELVEDIMHDPIAY